MEVPPLANKRVEHQAFDIVKNMDALSHHVLHFHQFECPNVISTQDFIAHPNKHGDHS